VVATKTGEAPYLSDDERVKLVQAAKQNLKAGRVLVAGSGHHGIGFYPNFSFIINP